MKRLLTTTAMLLALGTAAHADNHMMTGALIDYTMQGETDFAASELIGMRVYATDQTLDADMSTGTDAGMAAGEDTNEVAGDAGVDGGMDVLSNRPLTVDSGANVQWSDIGEIKEIFVSPDGEVSAVIVGVGGFLGIGEKDVALDMGQIRMVPIAGEEGSMYLVVNATQSELEQAPAFERGAMDDMAATATDTRDGTMADEAATDMDQPMFVAPMMEREGYGLAEPADLTSETLTGARVYGVNDEDLGEVSELILSDDGQVETVIVDVGGFLGLGEKPLAMDFSELQILRSDDGTDFRVYVDATQEQLEQRPAYEG